MTRDGLKADALAILYDATPPDEIKKRQGPRQHQGDCPKFGVCPQAHMMLDYVDARYVMDKLDRLGPENWQDRYVDRDGGSVRCGIGILIEGDWVWKWDVGTTSDIEPEKGSYSEAFKRAGVKWGIGRDLYGHKDRVTQRPAAPVAAQTPAPVVHPAAATPLDDDAAFDASFDTLVTAYIPPEVHREQVGVPGCPRHKLADGSPRPMKPGAHGYYCTAKDQSGPNGYCGEKA